MNDRSNESTPAPALIEVHDVRKRFGVTRAVDGISFDVARGEILGFLGPNGAGKSTTLKIITGYLVADSGTVRIAGHDVVADALGARRAIGYLPESLPLYPEMEVGEYLSFIAESRGLRGRDRDRRLAEIIELLGLGPMRRRPTGSLSKGYRQRVGLAQAIVHDPEVLVLDEPTNGLDPQQIVEIRALLARLAEHKAILFSTHILQEICAICTRILIIREGQALALGTPAELVAGREPVRRDHRDSLALEEFYLEVTSAPGVAGGAVEQT